MKSRKSAKASRKSQRADLHRKALRGTQRTFETLEERQLLTVAPWSDGMYYPPVGLSTAYLPPSLSYEDYASISNQQYNGADSGSPGGNGGGLSGEGSLGFVNVSEVESNNVFSQANFVNLGTGPSQNDGVAVLGNLQVPSIPGAANDVDYFAFDLKAGDIFDARVDGIIGIVFDLGIFDANRREIIGTNQSASGIYPVPESPLTQANSNLDLAFVVPADGRYYARVSDGDFSYTLTMRVRRPVLESQPLGTKQKIFLDFDGENIRREAFGAVGTARLSPLADFLPSWGLTEADENRIIDKIIDVFRSKFVGPTAISGVGGNGYFGATSIPGQFDIEILNSRDHADPFGEPNVSRIIIGGTQAELLIPTIGIAESVDVGNFDTAESAIVLLDNIAPLWGPIPRAGNVPLEDVLVDATASVAVHEAGHFFSSWHTLNSNASDQIMDTGGNLTGLIGVGVDGIYGTADDVDVQFGTDTYDPLASLIPFGRQNSAAAMAWGLSTGKVGGATISGNIFNDRNLNRVLDAGDTAGPQLVVWAETDGDGLFEPQNGEFFQYTYPDGHYSFQIPAGMNFIHAGPPLGWRLTTDSTRTVNIPAGGSVSNINFGLEQIDQSITGIKWNDVNGNGLRDAGEGGIGGVWIYLDLDGDNRIDIGEPATQTAADGKYSLKFPGPGTYTIREVVAPGYVQTFPGTAADNEHTITLTGNPATDANAASGLNFGNRLTIDFGDAPASYGAASHGFVAGLTLGTLWDAEQSSLFSPDALGDDVNNADDEDGIVLARPAVAGSTNNRISVTAENSTGSTAYLQGWVDTNHDGVFTANEKVISNAVVGDQAVTNVTFALPATAQLGATFARFRYSTATNVGPTGAQIDGEVEDYLLTVVDTLELAVDDQATVPRNSVLNVIDVLANDFKLPGETLEIVSISPPLSGGLATISTSETILYSPPFNYIGQDVFTYTMRNSAGETDTASVVVDVNLFFENPFAVDDSFDLATNSVDLPLNVLANDIEGQSGALSIISVIQPDKGGNVSIASGGKSLRYTPPRDFGGTEFLTYTVADAGGNQSNARVTLHTLPGDREDDQVLIQMVATDMAGNPISAVAQGQQFKIDVIVDDLRFDTAAPGTAAGVFAAYADLLYNLQLVSTVPSTDAADGFNFDVDFFSNYNNGQTGDATIPGIINEFGAFFEGSSMDAPNPLKLASITFEARSPGIARFAPDPADIFPASDTLLFDTPASAVPLEQIRYLGTSLEIIGDGAQFPVAVDDSIPQSIPVSSIRFPIDVLANDLPGSAGPVVLQSVSDGSHGSVRINGGRVEYTPNTGFVGADQFSYIIQDTRGIQSQATVTVRVGNADANDIVDLRLGVTDLSGQPIDQIPVGSQFQVRGFVKDLRTAGDRLGIFAAYQDVLYSSALVSPVASSTNDPDLGFQVQFGPNYGRVREGDILTPGVINEIGAVSTGDAPLGTGEQLLFVITMTANSTGVASFVADPADISPLHDTLTYEPVQAVNFDRIRYGFDSLTIIASGGGGGGGEGFTNTYNPLDVNADGYVSPIDALAVINELNAGGSRSLPGGGGEGEGAARMYVDTNADGFLSALDALTVINFLNTESGGEGEAAMLTAILSGGPIDAASEQAVDESLPNDLPALATEPAQRIGARMTGRDYGPSRDELLAATDSLFESTDDGLDGLLEQLATEVDERWKNSFLG